MYIWAGIVGMFYIVMFVLAGKRAKGKAPPGILGFFYPMALLLYKWFSTRNLLVRKNVQVEADLKSLHPDGEMVQLREQYYIKKLALSLLICFVGTLLGVFISLRAHATQILTDGQIVRGLPEEEEREIQILAALDSGEEKQFRVTVAPRQLTKEEAELCFTEFSAKLAELILGENISVQEVREDLALEESYEDYPFRVEWESERPDIVSATGRVSQVEAAEKVVLTAKVFYGESVWSIQQVVWVQPPFFSQEEILQIELERLLEASDADSRLNDQWTLPEYYGGKAIFWQQKVEDNGPMCAAGAVVVAILLFILSDKDLHDESEKRKESMRRCYPDVVQKLVLYLSAGLTVRSAFEKIAGSGENGGAVAVENPIYREMRYTCRELQNGMSEGIAYERFARRTGVQEYVRLTTLLVQNLKKGNAAMLQRLREEAERANGEQLQNGRRLAEEASTRLLFPMVLMLLVVMLIIMFPAFSSVEM